MNSTLTCPNHLAETATLKAVVLYEEFRSACRAKAFFDRLASDCEGEVRFSLALWRIDMLLLPGASGAALKDFGYADVVLLALRDQGSLPPAALEWVGSWAKCRADEESALVLLRGHRPTGERSRPPGSILRDLRELAQRHCVRFFCEDPAEPSRASRDYVEHLHQREQLVTATMHDILQHSDGAPAGPEPWRANPALQPRPV